MRNWAIQLLGVIRMNGGERPSTWIMAEVGIFHHTVRGETQETISERVDKAHRDAKGEIESRSCIQTSRRQKASTAASDAYCID